MTNSGGWATPPMIWLHCYATCIYVIYYLLHIVTWASGLTTSHEHQGVLAGHDLQGRFIIKTLSYIEKMKVFILTTTFVSEHVDHAVWLDQSQKHDALTLVLAPLGLSSRSWYKDLEGGHSLGYLPGLMSHKDLGLNSIYWTALMEVQTKDWTSIQGGVPMILLASSCVRNCRLEAIRWGNNPCILFLFCCLYRAIALGPLMAWISNYIP